MSLLTIWLLLLLFVIRFTKKTEVPVFKEMRSNQQINRKNPIIAILIGIVVSIAIFSSATYAINPVTRFLLKHSPTEEISIQEEEKTETEVREKIKLLSPEEILVKYPEYKMVDDMGSIIPITAQDQDGNWFHINMKGSSK